ncbi:glycoside hydrolase family 43 protein [Desertimonas flava]|uniref:glycoside hydrolase family 43 protein n=1 Tax=Desertimonas flava TaxID=2064846 RepID=UPI000E34E5E0|nr:glycoside hydrolase family 43 protein [Desertimonas flava]
MRAATAVLVLLTAAVPAPTGTAAADATSEPGGATYTNPVYPRDFPDPHVVRVEDVYYAYSTNTGTSNVPVIRSTDMVEWERVGDALPALPAWARLGFGDTWAPGVIEHAGRFLLYYVSRHDESGRQCIGVATAAAPNGPFDHQSEEPLVCQVPLGGSIDPYPYRDVDGQLYLYWKNDGNCCAQPVQLWTQRLADDGLTLSGEPVALIERDQPWEIPLIENPAMVEVDGEYYLFYSANRWDSVDYAVGYATCDTATGPCRKPGEGPILEFTAEVMGPGGQMIVEGPDGDPWMAYHAWTGPDVGYPAGVRALRIDRVEFRAGRPIIAGPTSDPQPAPGEPRR